MSSPPSGPGSCSIAEFVLLETKKRGEEDEHSATVIVNSSWPGIENEDCEFEKVTEFNESGVLVCAFVDKIRDIRQRRAVGSMVTANTQPAKAITGGQILIM